VQKREFPLGTVLSVTTGMLVSRDHVGGLYEILNFMTGDNLYTHQLPRAGEECKPSLLEQHPELADVEVPDEFRDEEHVWEWLAEQEACLGETLVVERMDVNDHTVIDPIEELSLMGVPQEKIIAVSLPEDEPEP